MPTASAPELSRIVSVARIRDTWLTETVNASAVERAALARRFGLVELGRLEATVRLRRARAGRYLEIDASLAAAVVQTCVVTLDPVPAEIDERFALLLGPLAGAEPDDVEAAGDLIVDLEAPEPLEGDDLDIGELVAQQLSLALDPYPRSAAAEAEAAALVAGAAPDPAESPFAILQKRGKPR